MIPQELERLCRGQIALGLVDDETKVFRDVKDEVQVPVRVVDAGCPD